MSRKQTEEQAERAFSDGSSGATADMASDPDKAVDDHRSSDTPASRPAEPLKADEKVDQLAKRDGANKDRQEALLDEAIEETFPGSDPISPKHIT
ncbi:MAG: hypothetical protein U1C74_01910 [Phenylobacterium sp.]|nr:hypothetical protein [Phenylobacterium sp.]